MSLEVVDLGPYERWEVNIRNRSDEERRVAVDSRLLSFEAVVPGKRQPVECSLPSSMLPTRRQTRYVYLSPGETRTFQVDPRMYCFETGDQSILVPGTFLRPRYGWSEKTKVRWSWGRRYEERLTQAPPFVAMLPDAARIGPPPQVDERSASGAATEDATDVDADQGLKQLEGEGFALRSDYKGWARTRLPKDDLGDRPGKDLKLAITYGSDAPNPRDITVRVELENQSNEAQRVYFRSDLVSFLVRGPDGTTECEAIAAERRAPDPQAFTTIGAGKRASFTIRLLEFCPAESFARPGFYYVSAVLPATARGALADEDMFTGRLATSAPRPVRLHRAELPFLIKRRNDAVSRAGGPSNARVGGGRTNAPQQTNTQPAAPVQAPAQPTPTPAAAPPPPPNPPPTPPPIPPPAPVR